MGKIRLAVVDDDKRTRELIADLVATDDVVIHLKARHGQDLLEQLNNIELLPNVCLLDLNMPIMDGFETAKRLRDLYPAVRILAYSTDDHSDRVEKILKCGAHGFVTKDFDPEDITLGVKSVYAHLPFIKQHETSIKSSGGKKAQYPIAHFENN